MLPDPSVPAVGLPPERQLQRRWAEARVPDRLQTQDGDVLRLTFAGTWNHGAGPDFQRARLQTADGRTLRGDVEVHRRAADWAAHGHDGDPLYAGVALHVLAEAPAEDGPAALAAQRVYVLPPSDRPGGAAPALPCERLALGEARRAAEAALARVALQRLAAKRRRLHAAVMAGRDVDEVAYAALLWGLGQGGNAAAMTALALELPLRALPEETASARDALLAAAERLESHGTVRWRRGGLRPVNRPEARLAAAAILLTRLGPRLAQGLAALAHLEEVDALRVLYVPRGLGAERARQLLVDVCYPLALLHAAPPDAVALGRRWLALGPALHGRTAPLRARLAAGGVDVGRNAAAQACLELERSYCRHGACRICPLARVAGRADVARGPLPSPNREAGARR